MQFNLTTVTLIVGLGACLAFIGAAAMRKGPVYMPAPSDTSQPVDYEAEKKREQKIRAKRASVVWVAWMVSCVVLYAIALLGPSFRKVQAAFADTPTGTFTPTITPTPTITRTPRDTSTPRPTWTPIGGSGTPAGSLMTDILTMQVASPTAGATSTPNVITNVVVQTRVVNVVQTVIVPQQIVITVPVVQTVVVPIYQTVVVTSTFTETPTPTPTMTETPTVTPTFTETPTP